MSIFCFSGKRTEFYHFVVSFITDSNKNQQKITTNRGGEEWVGKKIKKLQIGVVEKLNKAPK